MGRRDAHRFICKLRLARYGLFKEAHQIDTLGEELAIEAEEEANASVDPVIKARDDFVRGKLRGQEHRLADAQNSKHEGSSRMRSDLIKEFFAEIQKHKKCARCAGISPGYRRERSLKIFEKPLSAKHRAQMKLRDMKAVDAMATVREVGSRSQQHYPRDEGVADLDGGSSDSDATGAAEVERGLRDMSGLKVAATATRSVEGGGDEDDDEAEPSGQRLLSTHEVYERLNLLFEVEQEVLALVFSALPRGKITADVFFLRAVLVPPTRYRPAVRQGQGRINEAQQNALYKNILRCCYKIDEIRQRLRAGGSVLEDSRRGADTGLHFGHMEQAWTELQEAVNCLMDKTKGAAQGMQAQRAEDGIKQTLEKKDGLFRKNMMGKRVNFAARSVIAPDPHIEPGEIGVPPEFATKLNYAEPVTDHNLAELRTAVKNGPFQWPGAAAVELEGGHVINLSGMSLEDRTALADQLQTPTTTATGTVKSKKVRRHLANGDVVLMNRQPTLHKPSLMAHRVRVLPGERTLRMHYANCNTYNADFDGDEMNMHFPQNELARAEALMLAATEYQYLSGTQGAPLRGLIQDHLSLAVSLCNKTTFFKRGDYQQLVYGALRPESGHIVGHRLQMLTPAILKPVPRWTGKQVITTILRNITPEKQAGLWMHSPCKIRGSSWGPSGAEEETVIFQDGQFVTGILDKSQLGPSSGGLIHSIHEIYGPEVAAKLLSSLGRLLTRLLHMEAFTCGMDDLMLTAEGEARRRQELASSHGIGLDVASEYVGLKGSCSTGTDDQLVSRLEEVLRDDTKQHNLDMLMNGQAASLSTAVTKACLPSGLEKPFPKNHMQSMTTSGAKGSQVNANQISVNLGQQVLEGRRVPVMVSGRSLPCFRPYDSHVRAGGYIVNRFLTGIRVPEYYFHHMAGREGLIDTAVKTSRSGYLQRCIIKGMEGLAVAYDGTVRDSDDSLIQFQYGEDGLDVTKQEFLYNFDFVMRNFESLSTKLFPAGAPVGGQGGSRKSAPAKHMKKALGRGRRHGKKCMDPASAVYSPYTEVGSTSERFYDAMISFLPQDKHGLVAGGRQTAGLEPGSGIPKGLAENLLATKFMRSLVEPGEPVGVVAGQSIGEPSTQMTLNTFHLAGHSAKNVTLGIPRLREILMTAARKISTPSMTLYLREDVPHHDALRFAKTISKIPLSDVLDQASVSETIGPNQNHHIVKMYKIRLGFFPANELAATYGIYMDQVLATVETSLIPHLLSLISKEMKKRRAPDIGVSSGPVEMASSASQGPRHGDDSDDEDDDDAAVDEDATAEKQRANRSAAVSYGPNDEDDDFVQEQMAREASPEQPDDFDDEGYTTGRSPGLEGDDSDTPDDGKEDDNENSEFKELRNRVCGKFEQVTDFRCGDPGDGTTTFAVDLILEYPPESVKFLLIQIVKEAARRSLLQQVQGVGECTFVPDEKDDSSDAKVPVIHTAGVNVREMWQHSHYINVNRIVTNDIARVLDEYGIEACRANIIRELRNVFNSHNISVDFRHLNLIADYMTRSGDYVPFNRNGLKASPSPLTKMSFETTVSFLKDAVLDGDWDNLVTPSARLVMGKAGKLGSGSFHVLGAMPAEHAKIFS